MHAPRLLRPGQLVIVGTVGRRSWHSETPMRRVLGSGQA